MEPVVYQLEDEFHAELLPGEFASYETAVQEVRRIVAMPFGMRPNSPPCSDAAQCQRDYVARKYRIDPTGQWHFVEDVLVATSTAAGVTWHVD